MQTYAATYLVQAQLDGLKTWRTAYQGYLQARECTLALYDQNQPDGAQDNRNNVAGPLYQHGVTILGELLAIQDRTGREMNAQVDMTSALSVKLLVGAMLAAFGIGIGIAVWLSRRIVNRVKQVQVTLTSMTDNCSTRLEVALSVMARNDLTVEADAMTKPIENYGTDEIGETAVPTGCWPSYGAPSRTTKLRAPRCSSRSARSKRGFPEVKRLWCRSAGTMVPGAKWWSKPCGLVSSLTCTAILPGSWRWPMSSNVRGEWTTSSLPAIICGAVLGRARCGGC
jgi:hypothetical protein